MSSRMLLVVIFLVLLVGITSPIVFIWSLNTLFGLKIAYGFFEWLAALFLLGTLTGNGVKFKKE